MLGGGGCWDTRAHSMLLPMLGLGLSALCFAAQSPNSLSHEPPPPIAPTVAYYYSNSGLVGIRPPKIQWWLMVKPYIYGDTKRNKWNQPINPVLLISRFIRMVCRF